VLSQLKGERIKGSVDEQYQVYSEMIRKYTQKDTDRYLPDAETMLCCIRYTHLYLRCKDMPVSINGKIYYRTVEVCRMVGISRNTLLRWLKGGTFGEPEYRDWRGWRLITEGQVARMKAKTEQIIIRQD